MTTRLYYDDAYLTEFEANVVERADDGRRLYLDRTAFYPTSGGQPFDTGWLLAPGEDERAVSVLDVVDEGDRIAHVLDAPFPSERARGRVAWPRRFDHMQQHSGQHLLSAVFHEVAGLATVSVHIGERSATLDLDGIPTPEVLALAEDRANAIVCEDRALTTRFEEASRATGLRKASEREGLLRIVSIDAVDESACGGTHVRSTGAIGAVLLGKTERVRKATRVEFACGARAIRRARRDREIVAAAASSLSSAAPDVPEVLAARLSELGEAKSALQRLSRAHDRLRAEALYQAATPRGERGQRWHVERTKDATLEAQRGLAQAYAALPGAVFLGVIESPPALLLATSEASGLHAGEALKAALAQASGRGGGSARMAQATCPSADALEALVAALERLRDGS